MNSTRHKTHHAVTQGGSSLSRYQDVIVGKRSIATTLYFELCAWLAPIPGAIGLFLRKLFWPRLFAACGTGVVFGRGIILRHPGRVSLGQQVVIGDGATLDGRSSSSQLSLTIGDDVMIADHCTLSCKEGMLRIGNRVGLGTQTVIQSTHQCPTSIGDDVIIGPGCYIVGGGNYQLDDPDQLIRTQEIRSDGGCIIENNVWLGGKVTVLDGAKIGHSTVIAAGAVVTREIPPYCICAGVPARVIKHRKE